MNNTVGIYKKTVKKGEKTYVNLYVKISDTYVQIKPSFTKDYQTLKTIALPLE